MSPLVKWLMLEALLPMFGASLLFLLWGLARLAAAVDPRQFSFHWAAAIDPMGWLYGGAILAIQAGSKSLGLPDPAWLNWTSFSGALLSLLFLVAAMTERGQRSDWKPNIFFTALSLTLVTAIVAVSFQVQTQLPEGPCHAATPLLH